MTRYVAPKAFDKFHLQRNAFVLIPVNPKTGVMKSFLLAFTCLILLAACKKSRNANDVVGKWKLIETYRIGQIDWDSVNPSEAETLTFNNDYTYTRVPPPISSMAGCNGTYRITNRNLLFMTSACSLNPAFEEELEFERNGNTLILYHIMTATGIRSKYIKQ